MVAQRGWYANVNPRMNPMFLRLTTNTQEPIIGIGYNRYGQET